MAATFNIAAATPARPRATKATSRRYSRYAGRLLAFCARHRTVVADHVTRQFRDLVGGDRNTRLHLQTLVARGELTVRREHGTGRPNVYLITARGLRSAGDVGGRHRLPSGSHVTHELLITETAVSVGECVRARSDLSLLWDARFELAQHSAFAGIVPDYAFLFAQPQGRLLCLVEVSSGVESATRLGEKVDQYAEWSESNKGRRFMTDLYRRFGAKDPRPVFRLLFLVQNRRTGKDDSRLAELLNEVVRRPTGLERRVWATTVTSLSEAGSVDGAIWMRGDEVRKNLREWERLPKNARRRYVSRQLDALPHHRLFPPGVNHEPS